jgi:hypothetical protein
MITRIQFLRSLVGVSASVIGGVALLGCEDDDGSSITDAPAAPGIDAPKTIDAPMTQPDAPAATCTSATGAIGANHGHSIAVPPADIVAGVDKTYNIKGGSAHPHTVVVSAAMFTMLKAGMAIMVTSSSDAGHTHAVTVTCA